METPVDKPENHGKEEDSAEQQMLNVERTAEGIEDVEDDDPQELSGTPELKAERNVDKDVDSDTRRREFTPANEFEETDGVVA